MPRQDVKDESQHCKNYPKDENYAKCDETFVRDSLNQIVGPGYSPIWALKNLNSATNIQPNWNHTPFEGQTYNINKYYFNDSFK